MKLETLLVLGIANSRMKDGLVRHDLAILWVLARYAEHDGETLWRAIRATFNRRGTPIADEVPFGLTEDFAQDRQKQIQ